MHRVGRSWQVHALVILAYALLALALTWPLVAHIGTHVPGNGADDPPLTWNLWWVRTALLEQGANPFDADLLFHPLGINLAFYTLTVLNGLLSIPLQAAFGLIPASNILLLSSFVLSGYGAFLLASYGLRNARGEQSESHGHGSHNLLIAAFAAGLLYAFTSSKLGYAALGQWNIASSQWIPFYILYLLKTGEQPDRWRYPLMASLFLLFQVYAEATYATFLVLFTALWAVWQFLASAIAKELRRVWRLVVDLVLIALIFGIGLAPMLAMMIPELTTEGDIFVEGSGFAEAFSADLLGFFVPTMHHPLFGSLVESLSLDHGVGQHIYLGYSVLVLVAIGILAGWRRRKLGRATGTGSGAARGGITAWVVFWSVAALVFWLLALGPSLRFNGHDSGLPLPFVLVAQLPFFKGNRYPSRYSVMLFLSLSMLLAPGLEAVLKRASQRKAVYAVAALLLSFMLFENLSTPLPLSDMRVPPVYQLLAEEMPQDATLLDLPVAWRNGFRVTGTLHPTIMFQQYYQSVHNRPILAGNTSRNPPLKFQYFAEAPVISSLIALETGHEVDARLVDADRARMSDLLRFFNIAAIVIHPEHTGSELVDYVESTMPVQRIYEDAESIAYQVELPPWPDAWSIEPGEELARLSFAEGWGVPTAGLVWAQRREARLLVPLNGGSQRMAFRAFAPDGNQRMEVELGGQVVQQLDLAPGWSDHEVVLPAEAVKEGLNEIQLRFESLSPASQVQISARTLGQTGVESPVNLVAQSAGQEVGDFGRVYVDGHDLSPNERGYNVVVLDPESGEVEQIAAFDTHLDPKASRSLAGFLAEIPVGRIVAVVAADEASRLLGQESADALQGIGASLDPQGRFRWGHAIIGVQGAPAGTAMEAMDWMKPVTLTVGEGATEPWLAAAFATIRFTSIPE